MLFFNELKRRHGMTSLLCVIFIQEQKCYLGVKNIMDFMGVRQIIIN